MSQNDSDRNWMRTVVGMHYEINEIIWLDKIGSKKQALKILVR